MTARRITSARIDCAGKNTKDAVLGDLEAPDFYHVAVCIAQAVRS